MRNLDDSGEMWARDSVPLFDVFEPTYVQSALELTQAAGLNWGPLVFGQEAWRAMGGNPIFSNDPLTQHFRDQGLLELEQTFLRPAFYEPCFLPSTEFSSKSWRPTFAYQGKKQLWSITPKFSDLSVADDTLVYVLGSCAHLYLHLTLLQLLDTPKSLS